MSTLTAVPPVEFEATGLVLPQESDILAGAQEDINAAFGGNLNPSLKTSQGQLATTLSAITANANDTFALIVNGMDPDTNDGFMQDAIGRIYFLTRNPGVPTVVQCQCIGALGTVIPVGAQAQDTSGNLYVCTEAGSIPVGGSITLPFANVANGPIACPANTLTTIYQAIPGWDTINNSAAGVTGADVETPAAFRVRRANSVALNAHGSLPSIYAAVFNLPGVIDVFATENVTDSTVSGPINGNPNSTSYPLLPHSLYVAVTGGDPQAIAQAIWTKKDVGCNYNGNTSETVTDPSGYQSPVPTYTVKFEIPPDEPINFAVQIANSASLPSNIVALTNAAITAAFNGTDGSLRCRIAALILASKFYPGIIGIGPEVSLLSVLIGTSTATLTQVQMGIDQQPVIGTISVELV